MRELKGFERRVVRLLLLVWVAVLFYTAYAGQLAPIVHEAFSVAGAALLTFWLLPAREKKSAGDRARTIDYLGIALVLLTSIYAGVRASDYILSAGSLNTIDVVFGAISVVWLLEAARRNVGLPVPILFACMLLYTTFGPYMPWIFNHPGIGLVRSIGSLYATQDAMWGSVTRIMTITLPAFIIYGSVLLECGGGEALVNLAAGLAGRFTGGPAKIAVVSSGFFGMISGSGVANTAVTGTVTIPMMKDLGYPPHVAGAVEAGVDAGGLIMPPVMGAGAFLMATYLGVTYLKVAAAAAIPACLFFLGVFMGVHFYTLKAGIGVMSPEKVAEARRRLSVLKLSPLTLSFIVLIYFIVEGYTPEYAAFWGTAVIALSHLFTQGPLKEIKARGKQVIAGFEQSAPGLMMLITLGAAIQMVVYLIGATGLGVVLSQLIFGAAGTHLLLALLLVMVITIILGMGVPSTAAYVIAMAVTAPPLIKFGVTPMAAHLFIFYFSSFAVITPPVCGTPIVAAAIAGADWIKVAIQAMKFAIIGFIIPYMFVLNPALILEGDLVSIVLSTAAATVGVIVFAGGVSGYFYGKTTVIERLVLLAGGFLLIYPGYLTDLIGLASAGGVMLTQFLRGRHRQPVSESP